MASNSRQAMRDAEKKYQEYIENYVNRLDMIFDNSVIVENLPNDLPKRYLLKILRTQGGIAYHKKTKLFLPYVEKGIDVYGLPTNYSLIGFNGYIIPEVPPEDVVILRASDNRYCIEDYFYQQAKKIVDIDLAIEQNLEAVKTMTVVNVENESTLLSLANQNQAKRIGATVFYANKKSLPTNEKTFSSTNTGAEFLVDKMLAARKEIFNETLSAIGVNVANVNKKERVQNNEIRASQGYGIDSLRVLIETFNHDASLTDDVKMRLKGNTSLFEQYELDIKKQKFEMKGDNSNETND